MARMPSEQAIATAVAWLHCNEGPGDEEADCKLVADWINRLLWDAVIRRTARELKCPVPAVRRKLAEIIERNEENDHV